MTGQTLRVVSRNLMFQRSVRIVTGDAANPAIIGAAVTFAVRQAIRLKADVGNAASVRHLHDGFPTAMAGSAKLLVQIIRRPARGVKDRLFDLSWLAGFLRCGNVIAAGTVASFAMQSGRELFQRHRASSRRRR